MILKGLSGLAVIPLIMPLATAQTPWEYESSLEAVTVVSIAPDTAGGVENEDVLYELSFDNRYVRTLQSGLQIGGRLTLRGQRDHPSRPGFLGDFGTGRLLRGGYSGLSGQPESLDDGARGFIETAYIEFDGGLGEVRAGRDRGVAARFYEGAPSALSHARLNNPYLDPNGLKLVRTNHDLTGPAEKITYASPRILGLRAGVSYTPDADSRGLDRNMASGPGEAGLDHAFEVAANLSRRLRSPDLRIEAALAWSSAEPKAPGPGVSDHVETVSAGANFELSELSFGGSWLSSDNGMQSADYEAWEIGIGYEAFDTEFSLNYGEAEDDGAAVSSEGVSLSAAREVLDGLKMALAYQDEQVSGAGKTRTGRGIVVEITLTGNFMQFSGI